MADATPAPVQAELFGDLPVPPPSWLPAGMRYEPGFLSASEEAALLARLATLPVAPMQYHGHAARRRVVSYGGSFDFAAGRLQPADPLPGWLQPLAGRAALWAGLRPGDFAQALVAEYRPGTPLGWHRDVPDFEDVVGVSLLGEAEMRWRPWPPVARAATHRLRVAPRSIYLLRGPARWAWQHAVAPTPALRWSITLRTPRGLTCP